MIFCIRYATAEDWASVLGIRQAWQQSLACRFSSYFYNCSRGTLYNCTIHSFGWKRDMEWKFSMQRTCRWMWAKRFFIWRSRIANGLGFVKKYQAGLASSLYQGQSEGRRYDQHVHTTNCILRSEEEGMMTPTQVGSSIKTHKGSVEVCRVRLISWRFLGSLNWLEWWLIGLRSWTYYG